jgi:FHS family L-fucose permease-like MFS transporter
MSSSEKSSPPALWPVILITALFFFWGMANNLNDILIPQFKKAFVLTDFESSLVQQAFYAGYFIMAIPAGLLMRRFGYKAAVVTGLVIFAIGAFSFWPGAEIRQYPWLLGALFVIAAGLAFLETSANPLMTILGDEKHAAFRLNLAQAFNPVGSIVGLWIGHTYILSGIEKLNSTGDFIRETKAVQMPYLVIGIVVLAWAALVALSRFPAQATRSVQEADDGKGTSFWGVFRHPHLLMGVMAQFFYVGAQVGIWSYTIRYAQAEIHISDKDGSLYTIASLVLFMIGRFVGTGLMRLINPARLLAVFAIINIGLTAYAAGVGGLYGLYAMVTASFFMSIMFPTIFATSVQGLGPLTKMGASLLVMSIIGGAVLTAVMGRVSDVTHLIRLAIFVPTICFVVIAFYSLTSRKSGPIEVGAVQGASGH